MDFDWMDESKDYRKVLRQQNRTQWAIIDPDECFRMLVDRDFFNEIKIEAAKQYLNPLEFIAQCVNDVMIENKEERDNDDS